jgi:hypothetical protein
MSRFRISKANALGDLFLYDNIGQTRLVLSQDANELRQLLNEHFGVTECAPCKAIHHLHTEPPLDPCFMCGGLPCRCDEPASELDQDEVRSAADHVLDPASVHRFDQYIVVLATAARAWLHSRGEAAATQLNREALSKLTAFISSRPDVFRGAVGRSSVDVAIEYLQESIRIQERQPTNQLPIDTKLVDGLGSIEDRILAVEHKERRERIATAVYSALYIERDCTQKLAATAVLLADELIKKLDEQPSSGPFDKG